MLRWLKTVVERDVKSSKIRGLRTFGAVHAIGSGVLWQLGGRLLAVQRYAAVCSVDFVGTCG